MRTCPESRVVESASLRARQMCSENDVKCWNGVPEAPVVLVLS